MPATLEAPPREAAAQPGRVLSGRDMLCFSHDWTGDPLSKTHLMRLLAKDNRVLWVNSIGYRSPSLTSKRDLGRIVTKLKAVAEPVREVEPNLFVFSPLVIPAWGNPALRRLNARLLRWQVRRAMRQLRFRRPINWVFNPAAGVLAGQLGEERVIYYCVDEYTAFKGVDTAALAAVEKGLIDRADLVVVSAEKLLASKRSPNAPTVLVRHGVDFDHFARALRPETAVPPEIASLPRPVIGYFGLIADDWVDVPLLVHTARSFPTGSLVLLGKTTMDVSALAREPNVHLLGRKPYADLPAYCKGFDAAVIPFPVTEVTLNANPLKAREYLAAGLPVVSTDIPEVRVLPHCRIAGSPDEFVSELRAALERPGPQAAISESVRDESWAARLAEVERHLTPVLAGDRRP
jgi:glycosyltransferase involved in cell wall biosynthesis